MAVVKEHFGEMADGRSISLYTMTNKNGLQAAITDLGAVWVRMIVPDKNGNMDDVMLGFDHAEGYLKNGPHFGSVVGRIANRTGKGMFLLNGINYTLAINNGPNNLHSGPDYYDERLWNAKILSENSVRFDLLSPDGDQGYPGNAIVSVIYTLDDEDMLTLRYSVLSDADTPVNLTNHGYFNLLGHRGGSVLGHRARILADFYTPSDETSIPSGEILPVSGTPMDFTEFHEIGERINEPFDQLIQGHGYDHNWCLSHTRGEFALAAQIYSEESGRAMDVYTDQPGVQFYTANFLEQENGKEGSVYHARTAFCFETQNFPDAVNKPFFPSPIVKAGTEWKSVTGYRFYKK